MSKEELVELLSKLEQAIVSKDFRDLWYDNPNLKPCHKILNCSRKKCPAYGRTNVRCWQLAGTFCRKDLKTKRSHRTVDDCRDCSVFKAATQTEDARIYELINNIVFSLSCYDPASLAAISVKKNLDKAARAFSLTTRESEVLCLVLDRWPRRNIARTLSISPETVKMHIRNIYKKIGVNSRQRVVDALIELSTTPQAVEPPVVSGEALQR